MKTIAYGWCLVFLLPACKGSALNLGQSDPPAAIVVTVGPVNHSLGVKGRLEEAMSTSFQPAPWQYQFFDLHPAAAAELGALNPQHVHIQALDKALPWQTNTDSPAADWDFGELDAMVPQILAINPGAMFQIMAPPFLANSFLDNLEELDMDTANEFATYCGYLVEYYNRGGIYYPADAGTMTIRNPQGTSQPIFWWGILGDFNTTYSLKGGDYEQVYSLAVDKMLAANGDAGTLHFSAFEYSDPSDPSFYRDLDAFLGNVGSEPVDVIAVHVFPTSDRTTPDQEVFQKIPLLAADLGNVYARIGDAGSTLANAQIWVTENNINSQVPVNGQASPSGGTFVNDLRGTHAFFAAWRPYVFSLFGKAGNRALYHWDFTAGNMEGSVNPDTDLQQAEVDYVTGKEFISYWVDYWLGHMFPSTDSSPALDILNVTIPNLTSEDGGTDFETLAANAGIEVLATQNEVDHSVVVMVVDLAPEGSPEVAAGINNGQGAPRNVIVDISELGSFASGTLRKIFDPNADNSPQGNPGVSVDVTKGMIPVDLPGYGVAFLTLVPVSDGGTNR